MPALLPGVLRPSQGSQMLWSTLLQAGKVLKKGKRGICALSCGVLQQPQVLQKAVGRAWFSMALSVLAANVRAVELLLPPPGHTRSPLLLRWLLCTPVSELRAGPAAARTEGTRSASVQGECRCHLEQIPRELTLVTRQELWILAPQRSLAIRTQHPRGKWARLPPTSLPGFPKHCQRQ